MKFHQILFSGLVGCFFLAGCDLFNSKTPIAGKREVLFTNDRVLKSESIIKIAEINSAVTNNSDWTVAGGSLNHFLPVLAVPANPRELWKTSIGNGNSDEKRLISNLIIEGGLVFGMDTGGIVTALNKQTGQQVWTFNTSVEGREGEILGGGIAYGQNKVIVTTSFGNVVALDSKIGKEIWRKALTTPIRIAPTISAGRVFVVTISNELYALNINTGEKIWEHQGLPESTGLLGGGVPAIENNMIVVPYSSGELYGLHVENGYPVWTDTLNSTISLDSLSSISHIRARPVIYQGVLYAISHGGRMAALDITSGIHLWQKEISSVRSPAIIGQYLYLISINNELVCLNRQNGEIVWAINLPVRDDNGKINWAGPIATSQGLLITGSNGAMDFYSARDGEKRHSLATGQKFSLSPVVVDNKIYTLSDAAEITAWQ